MNDFQRMAQDPVSRRLFLQRMSAAGLGAAALSLFAGCGGGDDNNNGNVNTGALPTDFPNIPGRSASEVVLNYALTLEILEADLYRQALNLAAGQSQGQPLLPASSYTLQVPTGSLSAQSAQAGFLYLQQFAAVEAAHRDFLTAAIQQGGGTPVSANSNGYRFPTQPDNNLESILRAILPLEETGVRAYLGAAGFISELSLIQTAVSIYSTEARHSAAIAYVLGRDPGPVRQAGDLQVQINNTPVTYPSENTFEYYLAPATVINAIQAYLR